MISCDDYVYVDTSKGTSTTCDLLKNYMVSFDTEDLVMSSLESYHGDLAILNQFVRDFNRIELYIDNLKCSGVGEFILKLSPLNNMLSLFCDKLSISYTIVIILLCCQSTFYSSFAFINNAVELPDSTIVDIHFPKKIYLSTVNPYHICAYAVYGMVNTTNGKISHHIKSTTEIDLYSDNGIIKYDITEQGHVPIL